MGVKNKIFGAVAIVLILGIALMTVGFFLPYYAAENDMPASGSFVLEQQPENTWKLTWPAGDGAELYRVELLLDGETVFRDFAKVGTSMTLPEVPADRVFTLRVSSSARYRTIFGELTRDGEHPMEAQVRFNSPEITSMLVSVDGDEKTALLEVQISDGALWQYTLRSSDGTVLEENTPAESLHQLTFGENGTFPLPAPGETCPLEVRAFREEPGLILYGPLVEDTSITGESLDFKKLTPVLTETSKNTIRLDWEKTRGDHYEVQLLEGSNWTTLAQITQEAERTYTEWLEAGETRCYRVVAMDAQGQELVVSEPLEFTGRPMTQYATVWPVCDLPAYTSPSMGHVAGHARVGTAYCVLEEVGGMFAVRIDGETRYINSSYCMINLPEYLGGLCSYNITNSYSSIYAIHNFSIPQVTGVVTPGYEDVRQDSGSFLVPLLYPTARKLVRAAKAAEAEGYRIKIYDSFRPYIATREVYDLTSLILNEPLPDTDFNGTPKTELELPAPREGTEELTYGWLMTGRNFVLRSFLARDGSAHNLGIAMDLTLEDIETGAELPMQTTIHDLSHYSILSENNENADLLSSIMLRAGFSGLVSEWWHFQDDDAKESLSPPSVASGFSAEGWVRDDRGWKYRTAKGSFHTGKRLELAGTSHTFDDNGYLLG